LPRVPAVLFALQVTLLVLLPSNVGDAPNAYSQAMSYNRWGWSALTILCLAVFASPRPGMARPWTEALLGATLLTFLFYLKITYAVAGAAAVLAGLVLMPHMRRHWRAWLAALAALAGHAALPHNHAYLADIWGAATGGYARVELTSHLLSLVANREQFALTAAVACCLAWLWQRHWLDGATVVASVVIIGLGAVVRSQNAQAGDMPVALVACWLLYRALLHVPDGATGRPAPALLLAVMAWPLLTVTGHAATLTAYARAATRDDRIVRIAETNLRGLTVPADPSDVEAALAGSAHRVLSPLRDSPLRDPLSQHQYVQSLLAAARLFDAGAPVRVLVLDQVNALPFVLGFPPPRNSWLWFLAEGAARPAADVFADVDVVLVPRYATLARTTAFALETYGAYLSTAYPDRQETASWTVLRRARQAHPRDAAGTR
uniref:hypothetical protein n=1 Tax=Luteitalea sp. TaxID=2004800 RepID=UPI0025BF2295